MRKEKIDMFGLVPFGARKDVVRKDPEYRTLFDIFNEPFFHEDFMAPFAGWKTGSFQVDVKDKGTGYELTADLPGMKKEDISLRYENSYLTISANQKSEEEKKDEEGRYIRRERRMGSMSRSFYIDNIDEAKVTAEFKDGVLKVELPKLPENVSRTTTIEIK